MDQEMLQYYKIVIVFITIITIVQNQYLTVIKYHMIK